MSASLRSASNARAPACAGTPHNSACTFVCAHTHTHTHTHKTRAHAHARTRTHTQIMKASTHPSDQFRLRLQLEAQEVCLPHLSCAPLAVVSVPSNLSPPLVFCLPFLLHPSPLSGRSQRQHLAGSSEKSCQGLFIFHGTQT